MKSAVSLAPLILVVVIVWLAIVRPARRRQREYVQVQSSAQVGSRIMTASGVFGEIVGESGERLRLRVAPDVVIEVHRHSVGRVLDDEDATTDSDR